MKKIILTFSIIGVLAFVVSCSYNKKELPAPIEEIEDDPEPTPSNDITYTSHVKVIMQNCTGCHSSAGGSVSGINLETYAQVKAQADAGRILARAINGSPSFMPPSGSLNQTTLDTLQMWLDQGSLE